MKRTSLGYRFVEGLGYAEIFRLPKKGKPVLFAIMKGKRYEVEQVNSYTYRRSTSP